MNLWQKLTSFTKLNIEASDSQESDWEEVVYRRDEVNFHNEEERSRYIVNCLEQMAEATKEMDLLSGEYQLVTSYLTDMEEIEALPQEKRMEIDRIVSKLTGYDEEVEKYRGKKNRMSDAEYYALRKQENEVEEGIEKIRESERYAVLIKRDLKRLDGERHAHEFRKHELENNMNNHRGMAVIFLTAFAVCILLLLLFQFGLHMNTFIGYFLATAVVAIAMTVLAVRYMDSEKERLKVAAELNRIIQLQNTVKIRYVNNRQLLNYLYMKYHVDRGARLEQLWKSYQQEKEERRQYTEAQAQAEYYQNQLVSYLSGLHIQYPDRWIYQIRALLDKREMVEIRHGLILRRQSLREQIDYNKGLAETAKEEITAVAHTYPQYAREILDMTSKYEAGHGL